MDRLLAGADDVGMSSLPAGLTVRPAELTDAPAITAQMAAYTTSLLGFPKHSAENVADYLRTSVLAAVERAPRRRIADPLMVPDAPHLSFVRPESVDVRTDDPAFLRPVNRGGQDLRPGQAAMLLVGALIGA